MADNTKLTARAKRNRAIAAINDQITVLYELMDLMLNTVDGVKEEDTDKIKYQVVALEQKVKDLRANNIAIFAVPTKVQMAKLANAADDVGSVIGPSRTLQVFLKAAVKIGKMYKPA